MLWWIDPAVAQPVNTTPSRQVLEDASRDTCDGVSVIVQRCAAQPDAASASKPADDALTRSRAAAKAAFDRRDRRARAAALEEKPAVDGDAAPVVGAQRLGGVTVTGATDDAAASVEDVFQRALNPAKGGVPGPNGTTSTYAPDGMRYDCITKCVGPACCATVRTLPNPARDSNGILGH